jgi:hypothetical protein
MTTNIEDWRSDIFDVRKPQYLEGNVTLLVCPAEKKMRLNVSRARVRIRIVSFVNTVSAHTAV